MWFYSAVLSLLLAFSATRAAAEVVAKITLGQGVVTVRLFDDLVPRTVGNFVTLARQGFYDGTLIHRVVPGFVVQGGDPLGTGAGGPGYCFADEIVPSLKHGKAGILSMANSGPNTNGSQFSITLAAAPSLDGKHAVFGEITGGLETIMAIGAVVTKGSRPTVDVKIVNIEIEGAFTPAPLEKFKELSDKELEAVLLEPVHSLFSKVGASLALGKLGKVTFEKGRTKCGAGQASFVADYSARKGAKMLVYGKTQEQGFEIQQFQFDKGIAP